MADEANTSQLQDGLNNGQSQAHQQWQLLCLSYFKLIGYTISQAFEGGKETKNLLWETT